MASRAGKAGHKMAEAIIESVNLMYQNKTAISYLRELILDLQIEKETREKVNQWLQTDDPSGHS